MCIYEVLLDTHLILPIKNMVNQNFGKNSITIMSEFVRM